MGGAFQSQNACLEKMFDASMTTNLNYTMSFQQSIVKHNACIKPFCTCKRINIRAGILETAFHIRASDERGPGGNMISSDTTEKHVFVLQDGAHLLRCAGCLELCRRHTAAASGSINSVPLLASGP